MDKFASPIYFWYLNTKLEPSELRRQLREMRKRGVKGVCPHPWPPEFRPGTMPSEMSPEYLSDAYLDRFEVIYRECARLGMSCCFYDEAGWPSGSAGGRVRAAHPEPWAPRYQTPEGEQVEPFTPEKAAPLPNLLVSGPAEKFLELTHERFFRRFPRLFGTQIGYAFMDEPRIPSCWKDLRIAWAPDLAETFLKRKGYELTPWIPQLIAETAPPQVSIDYHDLLSQLFVERFLAPVKKWCRAHHILSGGHFGGEDEPERLPHGHGHIMRSLRQMDLPGVDAIWRQVFPGGANRIFPKYASSVARQAGRKHVLGDLFAVYGNGVTPEQRCFLADYMLVRGVDLLVLSKIALTNRKQFLLGCRPHFGPVDPLWKYSASFHAYCERVAKAVTSGKPEVDTVLYFDQRSAWAGEPYRAESARLREKTAAELLARQCDFDFADDDALSRATVEDGKLVIGKMAYSCLIVPETKFMSPEAAAAVKRFRSASPRPLLGCVPPAPQLRVTRRVVGRRSIYFCVNESGRPLDVTLKLDQAPALFRDPWGSGDYSLPGAVFEWHFEPFGSALFVTGAKGRRRLPAFRWEEAAPALKWRLKPLLRHVVGAEEIEIRRCKGKACRAEPGEWAPFLGADFSGDAVYSCTFTTERRSLWLDLGEVCFCASVKLNGRGLGSLFRSPFRFDLTPALKRGRNRLEVTVSNTLANALAAPGVRERIVRDFPPESPYEERQRAFEKDSLCGGLRGPVRFGTKIFDTTNEGEQS